MSAERELDALYLLARSHASFSSPDRIIFLLSQLLHPSLPIRAASDEVTLLFGEENGMPVRGLADLSNWSDVIRPVTMSGEEVLVEDTEEVEPVRQMPMAGNDLRVSPQASVHVFYAEYHLIFTLDLSPSIFAVDPTSGVLLLEQQSAAMEACFESLTGAEMQLGEMQLKPRLLVSVLLVSARRQVRVPLQAALLTSATSASLIASLRKELLSLQAQHARDAHSVTVSPSSSASGSSLPITPPELADSLAFAAQAAKLGPADACPVLILLTDGTAAPVDHTAYDGPLMRLTRDSLPCFVLRLGGPLPSYPPLAFFADVKALRYLSLASDARHLDASDYLRRASSAFGSPPLVAADDDAYTGVGNHTNSHGGALEVRMSFSQRLLLVRTLLAQGGTDRSAVGAEWHREERAEGWQAEWLVADENGTPIDHPFPWRGAPPPVPLLRTALPSPYELPVEISGVAALRIREGFKLAEMQLQGTPPNDTLQVRFVLPWQPHVHLEYTLRTSAAALNASTPTKAPLTVELALLALPDFSALFLTGLAPTGTAGAPSDGKAPAKTQYAHAHAHAAQQAGALVSFIGAMSKTDRLLALLVAHKGGVAVPMPSEPSLSALWSTLSYANSTGLHRWFRHARFDAVLRHDPQASINAQTQAHASGGGVAAQAHTYTYTEATTQVTAAIEKWASYGAPQSRMFVRVLEACSTGVWRGAGRAGLVLLRIAWPARNLLSLQLFFLAVAPPRRRTELAALRQLLGSLVAPTAPPRLPLRSQSVPVFVIQERAASSAATHTHTEELALAPLVVLCETATAMLQLARADEAAGGANSAGTGTHTGGGSVGEATGDEADVLGAYMLHSRRMWHVAGASGEMLLQFIIQTRVAEGWLLIPLSPSLFAFYREVPLVIPSGIVYAAAQYTVRHTPDRLSTDLWCEPQTGDLTSSVATPPSSASTSVREEPFAVLQRLVHGADARLAAALVALDTLGAALANATNNAHTTGSGATPPARARVALAPLLARASVQHEPFEALADGEAGHVNAAMAAQMDAALAAAAETEVQVSDEDGAALVPNAAPGTAWQCFAKRGDDDRLLIALSPKGALGLHVWEVSRKEWCAGAVAPDPLLQALLGVHTHASLRTSSQSNMVGNSSNSANSTAGNAAAPQSLQLRAFVAGAREAYSRAFARAVFTHLRRGGHVSAAELKCALTECREVLVVEQELAPFLSLLKRHQDVNTANATNGTTNGNGSVETESEAPDHVLEAQRRLASAFAPWLALPTSGTLTFFYRPTPTFSALPPPVASLATTPLIPHSNSSTSASASASTAAVSLADVPQFDTEVPSVLSQQPPDLVQEGGLYGNALFLRAELSVLPGGGAAQQVSIVDPRLVAVPAQHSRATLRLYFSSLPPDPVARTRTALTASNPTGGSVPSPVVPPASASASKEASISTSTAPVAALVVATATAPTVGGRRETAAIVSATKERLQEVVHAEILDSLRFTRPVTKATLTSVLSLLNSLPASSLATLTLSLSFFDMKEGRRLFPSLLQRTSHMALVRYGDVYFAIEPASPVPFTPLPATPALSAALLSTAVNAAANTSSASLTGSITPAGSSASLSLSTSSLSSVSTSGTEADMSGADGELAGAAPYSIPHWLILTHQPQEDTVTALFYAYSMEKEKSAIFRQVTHAVTSICEHINRLCLLTQLHDTRLASDLLIARDDLGPNANDDSHISMSNSSNTNAVASNAASSSGALESKAGQYACECQHTVVMAFSRRVTAAAAMRAVAGATLHPFLVGNRRHTFVYRELAGAVFYLRLSAEEATATSSGALTVRVHGLTTPSSEITVQLVALLETKLISLTVALLSTALLRNPLLKLTDEDVDFVRPAVTPPARSFALALPEPVTNAPLFAALAKHNLLTFLNPLHRAVAQAEDDTGVFVYNYLQEGPQPASSLFTHVGQGIAIVELAFHAPPSRPTTPPISDSVASVPLNKGLPRLGLELRKVRSLDDWAHTCAVPLVSPSSPQERALSVSVWFRGGVNTDALQELLTTRMHHVLCDYALETAFFAPSPMPPEVYVRPAKRVLKRALALASPSVAHCKLAWSLPAWELPSLLAELQVIVTELNARLAPSIHFTPDRKHPHMVWLPAEPSGAVSLLTNGSNGSFLFVGGKLLMAPPSGAEQDVYSRAEHMCFPHVRAPDTFYRASSILLFVRSRKLTALAYNLSAPLWEQLQVMLTRLASWKALRAHLLATLVHYKAGLPLHLPAASLSEALPMPTPAPSGPPSRSASSSASSSSSAHVRYTLDTMELLLNPSPARGKAAAAATAALQSGSSAAASASATAKGAPRGALAKTGASGQAANKAAPALADVLRTQAPQVPLHWTPHANAPEPLVRHALHLKQVYTDESTRARLRATQRQLHWQIWGAGKSAAPAAGYVKALLSQAQLIDVCRAPHGFQTHVTDDASSGGGVRLPELVFGSEGAPKDAQAAYSLASTAAFATEYATYVQSAHGAAQLAVPEQEGGKRLLLQRAWTSGAAVLEVSFKHEQHISVALHALDRALLTGKELADGGRAFASFLEDVLRLKAALHTQSFVFDAAVRFAATYLAAPSRQLSPVDCVRAMQGLARCYPHASRYARNSLLWGTVRTPLGASEELASAAPFDVFSAAAATAETYACRNLDLYGLTPALLLPSLPLVTPHSSFTYHLLALFSPSPTPTPPQLSVSFMALVVSPATHPLSSTENGEAEARAAREAWVDADVRARLARILTAAVADFQRDLLWRRLAATRTPVFSRDQLALLTSLAHGRDVCALDSRLSSLFGATPALLPHLVAPLFAHLHKLLADRTCFAQREAVPYHRLVVSTRPANARSLLLDLQLFPNGCLRLTLFARTQNEMSSAGCDRTEITALTNKVDTHYI